MPRKVMPRPTTNDIPAGTICLTVEEVAERLRLSPRTVDLLLTDAKNPLPSFKIGAARRIRLQDLETYIAQQIAQQTPQTGRRGNGTAE